MKRTGPHWPEWQEAQEAGAWRYDLREMPAPQPRVGHGVAAVIEAFRRELNRRYWDCRRGRS